MVNRFGGLRYQAPRYRIEKPNHRDRSDRDNVRREISCAPFKNEHDVKYQKEVSRQTGFEEAASRDLGDHAIKAGQKIEYGSSAKENDNCLILYRQPWIYAPEKEERQKDRTEHAESARAKQEKPCGEQNNSHCLRLHRHAGFTSGPLLFSDGEERPSCQ